VTKPKPYNNGEWTEARYRAFVFSALRQASMRWPVKSAVKRAANVKRGFYLCASCGEVVPASIKIDGKRKDNAIVDHIEPVVPVTGFDSWDACIARLYCGADNLQVLCRACHDRKTKEEREQRNLLTNKSK
jgi:5-methylcytosine-specific restriction endonuclease McrA